MKKTSMDSCNSQHECCPCRPLYRRRRLAAASMVMLTTVIAPCYAFTTSHVKKQQRHTLQFVHQNERRPLLSVINMVSFLEAPSSSISLQQNRKKDSPGGKRLVTTKRRPKPAKARTTIEIDIPEYASASFDFEQYSYVATTSSLMTNEEQQTSGEAYHTVPDIDSEILYEGYSAPDNQQQLSKDSASGILSQTFVVEENETISLVPSPSDDQPKVNRSSTMPGFLKDDALDMYIGKEALRRLPAKRKVSRMIRSKAAKLKRRQINSDAMYRKSASVPDSLLDYAHEIHAISRVTPKEEKELGTKTQEALRLQRMYDDLQGKYGREPTDEEWCAAAGKINMEALREAIQDGMEAKNQLVASNLRMVQRVVNLYIRNGLGSEYNAGDLMQDGTMVRAVLEHYKSI